MMMVPFDGSAVTGPPSSQSSSAGGGIVGVTVSSVQPQPQPPPQPNTVVMTGGVSSSGMHPPHPHHPPHHPRHHPSQLSLQGVQQPHVQVNHHSSSMSSSGMSSGGGTGGGGMPAMAMPHTTHHPSHHSMAAAAAAANHPYGGHHAHAHHRNSLSSSVSSSSASGSAAAAAAAPMQPMQPMQQGHNTSASAPYGMQPPPPIPIPIPIPIPPPPPHSPASQHTRQGSFSAATNHTQPHHHHLHPPPLPPPYGAPLHSPQHHHHPHHHNTTNHPATLHPPPPPVPVSSYAAYTRQPQPSQPLHQHPHPPHPKPHPPHAASLSSSSSSALALGAAPAPSSSSSSSSSASGPGHERMRRLHPQTQTTPQANTTTTTTTGYNHHPTAGGNHTNTNTNNTGASSHPPPPPPPRYPPQQSQPQHSNGSGNHHNNIHHPNKNHHHHHNNNIAGGSWQSDADTDHRREMIQEIVKLLKKDKGSSHPPHSSSSSSSSSPPDHSHNSKLPQMAKQLEVSLYRTAQSFAEYRDMSTLKKRLQYIAAEVQRKTTTPNTYRPQPQQHHQQPQPQHRGGMGGAAASASASSSSSSSAVVVSSSNGAMMMRQPLPPSQTQPHPPPPPHHRQPQQPPQMRMGSIHDNRHMMMSQQQQHNNNNIRQPQPPPSHLSSNAAAASGAQQQQQQQQQFREIMSSSDAEMKMRIKHKQQRLLLLHHSAKCPHEEGTCPVTQHCADMKRLWRHMEQCKDNHCTVPHCFSSRAILSHYRKCKDPDCPACGPVRQIVRKSKPSSGYSLSSPNHHPPPPQQPPPPPPPAMPHPSTAISSHHHHHPQQHHPQPQQQHPQQLHNNGIMMQQHPSPDELTLNGSFHSTSSSVGTASFQQQQQRVAMPPPPATSSIMPSSHPQGFTSTHHPQQQQQLLQQQQQPPLQHPNSNSLGSSRPPGVYSSQSFHQQEFNGEDLAEVNYMNRLESITLPPSKAPTAPQDAAEMQKIRHKQQRLLLLRHASKCPHELGKCPVTPLCASMKKLWEHIAHCKDQQCTVQHCLSSRYVLSHYRRCKDVHCAACAPVRETIRKSHEREQRRKQLHNNNNNNHNHSQTDDSQDPEHVSETTPMIDADNLIESPLSDICPPVQKRVKYDPASRLSSQEEPLIPSNSMGSLSDVATTAVVPAVSSSSSHVKAPIVVAEVSSSAPVPLAPVSAAAVERILPICDGSSDKISTDGKGGVGGVADSVSLLQSFTVHQLQTHLASLNRKTQLPPAKLKTKCLEVLRGLQTHQDGWVFNSPVDPVELGLPDYFDIIKKPMDLATIQRKLENGTYQSIDDFRSDVLLTFENAMTYNEEGSVVFDMAKELRVKFKNDFETLIAQLAAEDLERRQNDRACTLCGSERLLFEPPVYFCNGMNCQNQRIRRNSHFYVGGNNQYFWCTICFNELDEKIPIELVDMTVMKSDLIKKKNDEVHEESWVQCDTCQRWVHQICGLFNGRQNTQQQSEYCCPRCLCERQEKGAVTPTARPLGASDLPRTLLSEWLEKHIMKRVDRKKRQLSEEKALAEGISLEESNRICDSGPIFVRQVTSMDRKLDVRDLMKKRYEHKNYPDEFPFRCKCIVVFQEIEGVDTVLFALYLYEHGEDSPPPNQRLVYISYLDSVHFMRPRKIRTFVYHEILIAYLDYARRRGFSTVHIWACPPLKGDDYIFYAKPEDQKTPRDARLRQWYIDMLVESQKRNIVGKLTNMYDLYFANEKLDATAVPYLEGDYFPGEAENIIKLIEEGGTKKGTAGGKKKKSKSGSNKNGAGTRSSGLDEMAMLESGCFGQLKDLDRDQVMVKLGETIMPMKDSFIVAFLNWSGAKEEDMVVPPEIEKARIEYAARGDTNDDLTGSKRDTHGHPRDACSLIDRDGNPIKVINDDDEDLDCEFLNNRQAFLNLCRGNHYQFDELRRSKHTSMMVLWHLHNRDAPKFVQQCVVCSREILSGVRYHCNTCPDYDVCQECYKNPTMNRGLCTHKLQPIAVDSEASQERSGLSEEERQTRQRNLMLHIQLIEHAARCNSTSCNSSNCVKMKNYLNHSKTCRIKAAGGCKICKRIWTLLRIHAQKCKDRDCPIPQCLAIREKMRQLQKQQQAMDDRRRLEMNRHMRFNSTSGSGSD